MRELGSKNSARAPRRQRPVKAAITSPTAQCLTKIGCKHRQPSPIHMAARRWSAAEKSRNNMHRKIKTIPTLVAALIVVTASSGFAHNPGGKPDPMNASLELLKGAEFEQSFLQQMIQHHRSGIEMAKLASDHTKRPELREFAEKMIAAQQQEIEQMTKWLNEWFKASPKEVANEAADKEMKAHLSMMSGKHDADFDKAFLE